MAEFDRSTLPAKKLKVVEGVEKLITDGRDDGLTDFEIALRVVEAFDIALHSLMADLKMKERRFFGTNN